MIKLRVVSVCMAMALLAGALAACAPAAVPTPQTIVQTVMVPGPAVVATAAPESPKTLVVFGAFAAPVVEPWDGVIHAALNKAMDAGQIEYTFTENLGYAGDLERVLRETADQLKPDIIFGDAFGNEEAVRRVAADYPEIAFVFGSGLGPSDPNVSVFDNWIHEPAYLSGMLAGGLTKTGKIGVVGGYPVPEVNRLINAFTAGAKEVNPEAKVLVTFINSWFDPAAAKEAALAQIDSGADVLFAERFGVIEAAAENGLFAFGNMSDQNTLAPDFVVSGPVWNLDPTVAYVINQIRSGAYTAQDLKDFSMVGKGGASLAPFYGTESKMPADLVQKVKDKEQAIKDGLFRVDIDEQQPAAVN